jgi:hypothetical protein
VKRDFSLFIGVGANAILSFSIIQYGMEGHVLDMSHRRIVVALVSGVPRACHTMVLRLQTELNLLTRYQDLAPVSLLPGINSE